MSENTSVLGRSYPTVRKALSIPSWVGRRFFQWCLQTTILGMITSRLTEISEIQPNIVSPTEVRYITVLVIAITIWAFWVFVYESEDAVVRA